MINFPIKSLIQVYEKTITISEVLYKIDFTILMQNLFLLIIGNSKKLRPNAISSTTYTYMDILAT